MKVTLLLLLLVAAIATATAAQLPASKLTCATVPGTKSEAELKASPSGIYNVHVTFIEKRPSDKEIDRVLRDCVAAAVKRDGSKDILGLPWLRKRASGKPSDDDLLDPYGSLKYLSYQASSKTIEVRDLKLTKKKP